MTVKTPKSRSLTEWLTTHTHNINPSKQGTLRLAAELAEATSRDLELRDDFVSKDHLLVVLEILAELGVDVDTG